MQFNKDFTFHHAIAILPYLEKLGIEAIYASPILQPVRGSTHGYDVCDPSRLWDELGDGEEFFREVKARGMGLLFDLVANHMAVSDENPWWKDVCENGQESKYAHYFDIQWKEGKIASYRRFFDIDSLIALRVEEPDVFDAYHELVFHLFDEGKIDGFRVDHPDGLYDPKGYFSKLKKKCNFVIAEKILEKEEKLPSWEVDGTVGYEFLNDLTNLYIDPSAEGAFTKIYEDYIGHKCAIDEMLFEAKEMIAREYFTSELEQLGISDQLIALLAAFPVYRSYLPDDGDEYVDEAFSIAKRRYPELDFSELREKFSGDFAKKFEQLAPPIMAKGLEDTLCYRYARFVAVNEVGGHPKNFGMSADEFHKRNMKRSKKGIITVSTHDTKRSHDVRMRLAALSEMPEKYEQE
ncbi:MAG: alpha-amylase family glycosyl hydrolase, partial [Simkaniaceae bacterium]|nr:alpha-amylase family glycosyl hydrolase [Simkaniaceae bacterium]